MFSTAACGIQARRGWLGCRLAYHRRRARFYDSALSVIDIFLTEGKKDQFFVVYNINYIDTAVRKLLVDIQPTAGLQECAESDADRGEKAKKDLLSRGMALNKGY